KHTQIKLSHVVSKKNPHHSFLVYMPCTQVSKINIFDRFKTHSVVWGSNPLFILQTLFEKKKKNSNANPSIVYAGAMAPILVQAVGIIQGQQLISNTCKRRLKSK
ncbi:MAG: hypothetical protein ACRC4N_13915, partial [Gammaproteobacteria bacterium]